MTIQYEISDFLPYRNSSSGGVPARQRRQRAQVGHAQRAHAAHAQARVQHAPQRRRAHGVVARVRHRAAEARPVRLAVFGE